ncbi:hypothetical protein TanjilG_12136 [Lupinus angustifolius]|uniref:Peroxidase n=1 Tax=Lupinus angustifolius TaxID=3871 RepID=A0A1J7GDR4_LUPAN|nr:hypothetical protein TanjilG_12136 [Lupinus angustifolius]
MNLFSFLLLVLFFYYAFSSDPSVGVGYKLMVAVPEENGMDFKGRGFLMETNQIAPSFRVALSIEPMNGKYSCSLEVFLGDVKVWDSGHYSRFYITEKCLLEFTKDGDLLLKGPNQQIGWKTGTYGQGVEGCDGSVLLDDDDTSNFHGEKNALGNANSLRGFDVIDSIKTQVENLCPGVVSCADILSVAARDSVVAGCDGSVLLDDDDTSNFHGEKNALGNANSLRGFDVIDSIKTQVENLCPGVVSCADILSVAARDSVVANLQSQKGLLHSDQELFNGGSTDSQVNAYSTDSSSFATDFANAMVKMGNLGPLTGSVGQIRTNCRKIN